MPRLLLRLQCPLCVKCELNVSEGHAGLRSRKQQISVRIATGAIPPVTTAA